MALSPLTCVSCTQAVLPAYRGQGLGKSLVRVCEGVARDVWGYDELYLHLDASDPTATTLYNHMGYREVTDPALRPTGTIYRLGGREDKGGGKAGSHASRVI